MKKAFPMHPQCTNLADVMSACRGVLYDYLPLKLEVIMPRFSTLSYLETPPGSVVTAEVVAKGRIPGRSCAIFIYMPSGVVVRHHPGSHKQR